MEENNIIISAVNPETFEFQDYSTSDQSLIAENILDTVFSGSTDYIEAYVYDENQNQISSQVPFTNYSVTDGDVVLTPSNDLERLGFNVGSYFITYDFFRPRLGSTLNSQYYISEISSDRTEIRLDSTIISNELLISSSLEFIEYRDTAEYFVDFLLNFNNNQQIIANNLELSLEDEDNPTILIKLYDPLPGQFNEKSLCSVVESISTPQAYNVNFPPLEFNADDFTYILGPNYSLDVKNQSGTPGMDQSYSTLVSSDLTSSFNQVDSLLNRKEIEISINYEDYNDFIYFSSAQTRLQNFYYKVGLIQSASLQLGQITSSTTGSLIYSSSQANLSSVISTTIKNFDGYEYFLYFDSGSKYSYPKSNSEPPYTLYPTGSTETLNWLGSQNGTSAYYGGQALSASNYDETNQNALYYAIPEYLRSDVQNQKYELFVDMVGQHYDNIWLYTKNLTTKFDADNRLDYGIAKDMVADAIRDFGVKLYSNNFNTDDLYTAFLGLTPSGSSFPFPFMTGSVVDSLGKLDVPSGYEYVDSMISASDDIIPLDDVNKRLYKRIYHNIPYLLKTKGTVAGLRALITSYGIPDTILRIDEFGGKDRNNSQDWDLKQDFYNLALNTTSSAFTSSFNLNTDFQDDSKHIPETIQFRFKTNGIPSGSSNPVSQSFFYTDSFNGGTTNVALGLEYNEGLLTKGTYSGSVESSYKHYGTLKFYPNANVNPTNFCSLYLPFWDGGWWSVQLHYNDTNDSFTLFAANKHNDNLLFTGSDTKSATVARYRESTEIYWLPQSGLNIIGKNYEPFSGSFQEIRYYGEQISESMFFDYTMNPYSFEGNGVNGAPDQLAFRLPLGTMIKTGSDWENYQNYSSSIHPKITGSWVTTSSFTGNQSTASFEDTPTWLNNTEDIYLDQTPSGMRNRVTEKIQVEELVLPEGDTLSGYRSIQQSSYSSGSMTPNINYLEVAFSPQNQINNDIIGQLGYFNIGEYIGDPRLISSSDKSYPALDILRDAYFEKYITNYNLTDFIRLIKFFDNSLFKMIEDFTPARTSLSSGVVIKQHLLERNRQRPAIVTSSFEQFSGSVTNLPKDYSTGSSDFPQYDFSGSSIYVFKGGTGGSFENYNGLKTSISGSLGLGPNNRFNLTQSWEESWETFSGSAPIDRSDQREFYNGEFSGSNVQIGLNDLCSAYFKPSNTLYRFIPVFFSVDGLNQTQQKPLSEFLTPSFQPPTGFVYFWSDGSNVRYIKMSLTTYNDENIADFIRNVSWVSFLFNSPINAQGEFIIPNTVQTFYLESIVIQPGNLSDTPSVGTALGNTIVAESSTVISSNDGAFANFNLSASGDFQWHATQNTANDPNPVLDTGISASVPQGYFPLTSTYPTESFFRGWASSNFYTNGTYNAYNGVLFDPLDNFNTGSHEKDNTDTTIQTGIDPASNFPWFMNAGLEGEGKNWLQIPSESFLDYANIPGASVGPTSTNNYFNLAFTSASSVEPQAVQGVNYYYNASNNAIYMSGSEFQNENKDPQSLFSGSLVSKLIDVNSNFTSYTPYGQTSLTIPIAPDNQLWAYTGEVLSFPVFDSLSDQFVTDAWRYNRYIHRPFQIYYLTETGSGQPAIPYEPLLFMSSSTGPTGNQQGNVPFNALSQPTQYTQTTQGGLPDVEDDSIRGTVTMLGTQTDDTATPRWWQKYLDQDETAPSVEPVSGSFQVLREDRQVRPFIFTSYRNIISTPVGGAKASGSFVAISKSDGTPFAKLQMFQYQAPQTITQQCGQYVFYVQSGLGESINIEIRKCEAGAVVTEIVNVNAGVYETWCAPVFQIDVDPNPVGGPFIDGAWRFYGSIYGSGYVAAPKDDDVWNTGHPGLPANINCFSIESEGDLSLNSDFGGGTSRNEIPFFYGTNGPNQEVAAGDIFGINWQIPFGSAFDGLNTSSLSFTGGNRPGGNTTNTKIVLPAGNYIFTMSAFDTGNQMSTGFTEFGLYTTYGDYANYFISNIGDPSTDVTLDFSFKDTEQNPQTLTLAPGNSANRNALLNSVEVTTAVFDPENAITSSIPFPDRYIPGAEVLGEFATKVVDAYVVYSSSMSSSIAGSYRFDVVPNLTDIYVTASVVVSSYTDDDSSLYGNAEYGTDEYGGGAAGGGTTWTTASLKIYTGSFDNFPTKMPVVGDGNVIAETSSHSTTHNTGERITLMFEIPGGTVNFNEAFKMALEVGSGSDASSVVQNSLVVTEYSMSFSSSFNPNEDPSIPANFDNDSNFALAYDCQPLLNNFSNQRQSSWLYDVDYNFGTVIPSNWAAIISQSAIKADVPDSNYTQFSSISPRYLGKQAESEEINIWTPGDFGTFGKVPTVEVSRGYATYFKEIYDPYPLLNNKVQYDLAYVISQDGEIVQPKLTSTALYNIQGTFDAFPNLAGGQGDGVVSLTSTEENALLQLQGSTSIYKIAQRAIPILYTQQSGIFPNQIAAPNHIDGDPTSNFDPTSSLTLVGAQPIDINIQPTFNNYSLQATDVNIGQIAVNEITQQTFVATQKTPSTQGDPAATSITRNVTASAIAGGNAVTGTGKDVYELTEGVLWIPVTDGVSGYASENTAGDGEPTSQPYNIKFSLGVDMTPCTYNLRTGNNNKGGGFSTTDEWGYFAVGLQYAPNSSNNWTTFSPSQITNLQVICENFYVNSGGGSANTTQFDYRAIRPGQVGFEQGGIKVNFNSSIIRSVVIGAGGSAEPANQGGPLLKQRWTVKGTLTDSNAIKQGYKFRVRAQGDIYNSDASQAAVYDKPEFFPATQEGSSVYNLELIGLLSNPIEDPIAPFWKFSGSGAGLSTNTLVCTSAALNKAYNRDFVQKDITYTASINKNFPGGLEPFFTTIPTIKQPWVLEQGDEIRFTNDEDYSYTITQIVAPDANSDTETYVDADGNFDVNGTPSLIIRLDGEVPPSFNNRITQSFGDADNPLIGRALDPVYTSSRYSGDEDGVLETAYREVKVDTGRISRNLDFFIIRRYESDSGVIITNQEMPYNNPPTTASSAGFLFPTYPTEPLKVSPDELLTTLRDNKLIE
jgi:hypothetical protein